ncbi:T9SS type A sorting domain-containing protein [Flavobacterium pallidum]|uniref:Secretion system C-terminal sorting domain-containing protein n=1 Tax=Flavobacterium pallidum TaxID=2172098 RepID=A0A2S1SKV0_9FLAO|nr:T9SS type A sorting domain-containing protein [Flavobacterium pallidum]AWI27044.1 hypothetical protein HYN49_14660 [Flavobacterium pallidum]
MKTITNAMLVLALACSCLTYGQPGCGSTVSVTSPDKKTIFSETVYDAAGHVQSATGAIPWDTPVHFRIISPCGALSYFLSPELQGGYDSYETGSSIFNTDNRLVEFTTSFTNPMLEQDPKITILTAINGNVSALKMNTAPAIPPPPPPATCINYEITRCGEMNCIRFTRFDAACHLCYKVFVRYTDGTSGSFPISFLTGEKVMICSEKLVDRVIASVAIDCKEANFERKAPVAEATETQKRVTLYPNPAQSEINFEGDDLSGYKISVFDANGRKIIDDDTPDHPISLSNYASGIYFYTLTDEKGYSQQGKLMKQ